MITINFTRNEVLDLMKELPVNHWMQERLLDFLAVNIPQAHINQTVTAHTCEWQCYGIACGSEEDVVKVASGKFFCGQHTGLLCRKCGSPADHGCPEELQFVCGAPLCKNCNKCS